MEIIANGNLCAGSYPVGLFFNSWKKTVEFYAVLIKSICDPKETIVLVVTGSSGAILATMVALELEGYNVEINHVKKEGETSHWSPIPNITEQYDRYFIIDDIISSGSTVKRLLNCYPDIIFDAIIVSGGVHENCIDMFKKESPNFKTLYCESLE